MSEVNSRWGEQIAVEDVGGIPFRMYVERPRRIEHLLDFASRWGSRPHIVQGDRVLTFEGLRHAVASQSRELQQRGVRPGDRVFIMGWNGPDWVVNFWAVMVVGAVPVLVNTWWSEGELAAALELLRPALVLADTHAAARVPEGWALGTWATAADAVNDRPAVRNTSTNENDSGVIIFTSGTSGRPKAVVLSHRALLANLQMLLNLTRKLPHQIDEKSADIALHTGPLFHIGGAQGMMRGVTVGNTLVMPRGKFDPAEALSLIEKWKINRWAAVPTMISRVLDHPDVREKDLRSLRAVTLGGAPLHFDLQQRIRTGLPGAQARIATGYGLTENGGQATAASDGDTTQRPGTSGRALPLTEIKIVPRAGLPDGEIVIRAPTQMTEYFGEASSPIDADGWLSTGDLGRLDDDGYIWITGRCKDLIIRGGENIAPAAVECALAAVPGVVEAAVFGIPHPDLGEEVAAVVVIADEYAPGVIKEQLRTSLASFAIPTWWRFQREPLPVNQTGKVDKNLLVTQVRAELAQGKT